MRPNSWLLSSAIQPRGRAPTRFDDSSGSCVAAMQQRPRDLRPTKPTMPHSSMSGMIAPSVASAVSRQTLYDRNNPTPIRSRIAR